MNSENEGKHFDASQKSEVIKSSHNNDKRTDYDGINDYIFQKPVRHGHKKKKMKRWKKVVLGTLISVVSLLLAAVICLLIFINVGKGQLLDGNEDGIILTPDSAQSYDNGRFVEHNGKKYEYNKNITSFLFMGIDKPELTENEVSYGRNGDADVLLLLTLDTQSGETNLISISRDTMAEMDVYSESGKYAGTKTQQICLAYAYGNGRETSCENEVEAVRKLFYNVPINSYLALDLSAISVLNDTVGGVTVESLETFKKFTKGETVTLYGDDAETYVRSRNTEILDSNNTRMERQKQYLKAFFDKVVYETKNDLMTPVDLFNQASPYMVTNIGITQVSYLSSQLLGKSFSDFNMQNVPGEVKQGENYAEYYVDEEAFYEIFLDVYYNQVVV